MNETLSYGLATADDVKQLVDLRLAYLADDFGELPDDVTVGVRAQLPGYFTRHLNQDLLVYVARETITNEIVSCVWLLVVEKPASLAFPNGLTGQLLNVYTMPFYRRRGIAAKLVELMLQGARDRGLHRVDLKATEMGKPLYAQAGFLEVTGGHAAMELVL